MYASNESVLATTMLGRERSEEEKPVYLSVASSHRLPRSGGQYTAVNANKSRRGNARCAKMTMYEDTNYKVIYSTDPPISR